MTHRYDDIINLPHHVSQKHAPMARADRAAQFSPFAALTGLDAALRETAWTSTSRPHWTKRCKPCGMHWPKKSILPWKSAILCPTPARQAVPTAP